MGGCKTYGGRKTYQRTRSPENFWTPPKELLLSALSWIFVQEKQSTDTWGGWKTYRTRGGPKRPKDSAVLKILRRTEFTMRSQFTIAQWLAMATPPCADTIFLGGFPPPSFFHPPPCRPLNGTSVMMFMSVACISGRNLAGRTKWPAQGPNRLQGCHSWGFPTPLLFPPPHGVLWKVSIFPLSRSNFLENPVTSLNEKVRPFFLSDNSIWTLPSAFPLAITAFGGPEGYFTLAIRAFGAFRCIVPKYYYRLGKWTRGV